MMQIVKIKDEKFLYGYGYIQPKGQYCFKDERGYIGFKEYPQIPYFPFGGKKALERILKEGGFSDESDLVFIKSF